jgi:hypothetical protein
MVRPTCFRDVHVIRPLDRRGFDTADLKEAKAAYSISWRELPIRVVRMSAPP